jgi:hypothetical protein
VWEIITVTVHCKETEALAAENIYVPSGGDSEFAGATCAGPSSAGNGNRFVHITCAEMTGLTQTGENALFVVTPITIWPRWQPSRVPALATGPIAEARKTKTCKSV